MAAIDVFVQRVTISHLESKKKSSIAGFLLITFFLSFFLLVDAEGQTNKLAQGTTVSSVPDYFARCAGETGQCSFKGPARVIFGAAVGNLPDPRPNAGFTMQTFVNGADCSNNTFGDPASGRAKACWVGPVDGLPAGKILAAGGSNYPFSVQNFESWDDNQRVVIGNYHLDPTLVEAQLRQMYKSGQPKVSLFIWYMPFDNPNSPYNAIPTVWPDVYSAYINSAGGQLSAQAQQNLKDVLGLIKTIGFNHVTLRFAPIGTKADPSLWGNQWNEAQFQQDEAFVFNTRAIMEATLAGTTIQRQYDLGVEKAGIPHNLNSDGVTFADGQTSAWTSRLWSDYVHRFGKADSYGFSIAYSAGTLAKAIAQYDLAGTRPNNYAVDTYASDDLWNVYQELLAAGELPKPLIIQETMYNEAAEMQVLTDALAHLPLTIAYVQQWPFNTNTPNADGIAPPTNYGAFGGSTAASGTILAYPCTLAPGARTCTTNVSWATSNATNVRLLVNGVPASNLPNILTSLTGTTTITLGLTPTTLALQSDQGILAQPLPLVKSSGLVSSLATVAGFGTTLITQAATVTSVVLDQQSLAAIDPTAPVITRSGLGGAAGNYVWALGSNISARCAVNLFDPNSPSATPIATVFDVSCASTTLSFAIPPSVLNTYPAFTFTVVNSSGSASQPLAVQLASLPPQLSMAGLGGNANQMIWAIGSNIAAGCSVNLYDASSVTPSLLQTVSAVSCETYSLSFTIPAYILSNFAKVKMSVVTPNGQASPLLAVTIRSGQ